MQRSTLGDEHPDTLTSMNNLATLLLGHGDLSPEFFRRFVCVPVSQIIADAEEFFASGGAF